VQCPAWEPHSSEVIENQKEIKQEIKADEGRRSIRQRLENCHGYEAKEKARQERRRVTLAERVPAEHLGVHRHQIVRDLSAAQSPL
jgi:hypothetical protein